MPSDALVGREQELETALAVLGAGRHLLLRGPAGVGKTTLAVHVCARLARGSVRVDGDGGVSAARLAGWFDPPLVLRQGYRSEAFTPGPLTRAMSGGLVLLANDLDRIPEAAQNLMLPALDEGILQVPHLGQVRATAGFLVVATSAAGGDASAGLLSEALRDRFELLELEVQSEVEEVAVVRLRTECEDEGLVRAAVRLTRATRVHPALARGASVRAAISTTALAARLGGIVGLRAAAGMTMTTRVELDEEAGQTLPEVLDELCEAVASGAFSVRPWPARPPRRCTAAAPGLEGAASGAKQAAETVARAVRDDVARSLAVSAADLDGWMLAARLTEGRLPGETAGMRVYAEQLAAAEVLRRAQRLVGPLRAGTRPLREPLSEPHVGELCVEATLENLLGKEWPEEGDLVVERREEQRREVVLIIDTSLSMAGEKMALAAVAAAVLALKLHPGDLSLVLFSDEARVASRLREEAPARELVRRLLARPCGGATNLAAALELGLAELRRGRDPRRSAVLVSDGLYTAGPDPRPSAARFAALHVLLTGEGARVPPEGAPDRHAGHGVFAASGPGHRGRRESGFWISPRRIAGRDLAAAGGGRVVPVDSFRALPRRMLDLADHVLR